MHCAQILCGGENVYCTEVEAVLYMHPAVAVTAVFGVPNAVLGEMVRAAVILKPGHADSSAPGQLVAWCQQRLAHYKVPAEVHLLEAMPTTGSGKILKTELRKMFSPSAGSAPGAAASLAPPAGSGSSNEVSGAAAGSGSRSAEVSATYSELLDAAIAAAPAGVQMVELKKGDAAAMLETELTGLLVLDSAANDGIMQVRAA